ncbi:unnamed protein product [Coregonus sp. 'balchen']|nr:unnamed protein product [Coregonus sp. 'balchen']
MRIEDYRRSCHNVQLCSTPEVAQRKISFERMLRTLSDVPYEEYQMNKIIVDEPQQPSISQFLDTCVGRYSLTHPQQKAISNAILSDLIIDCNFPLSIVENKSFRHFLAVLDSKYTPWNLLKELVDILKPFGEATDLTQGEKVITISAVVPSILSLNHHLEKLKPQVRFLSGLVRGLQASLKKKISWDLH